MECGVNKMIQYVSFGEQRIWLMLKLMYYSKQGWGDFEYLVTEIHWEIRLNNLQ